MLKPSFSSLLSIPLLRQPRFAADSPKRILLYCASNIGLGHLFRLLRIAAQLRRRIPGANILLITDRDLPAQLHDEPVAVIKLPGFEFMPGPAGSFAEKVTGMDLPKENLRQIRANLILSVVHAFQPHVWLMDTAPHGKQNELRPALDYLARRRNRPVRILQMRDIPFPPGEHFRWGHNPQRTQKESRLYDYLFVAGNESFFDVCNSYGWPEEVCRKVYYLGFVLPPELIETQERVREGLSEPHAKSAGLKRIVASFGGGWEAEKLGRLLIEAYFEISPRPADYHLSIYTGPAVSVQAFNELESLVATRPDVSITRFAADFPARLAEAELAILQAGSTPFQILETDIPMLIYHRAFSTAEQQYRAKLLARYENIRLMDQESVEAAGFGPAIRELLQAPRVLRRTGLEYRGAERAADAIVRMLSHSGGAHPIQLKNQS